MTQEFSIFRKFPTLDQAKDFQALLNKNEIQTILADNVPPVDVTFSGSTLLHEFEIRIKPSDFEKADVLLEENTENSIHEIDKDYYLFEFTDDELYEVLLKSDEWSPFDYALAQKILVQREKPINKILLNSLKKERLEALAKPDGDQKIWIIGGYLFSVLGGFLGLIIGYFLWTSKKTLPNGQKVFSYSESDRIHGKYIFYIGLIVAPSAILIKVMRQF